MNNTTNQHSNEIIKQLKPFNNGFLHLFINILLIAIFCTIIVWISSWSCMTSVEHPDGTAWIILPIALGFVFLTLWILDLCGFVILQPNQTRVLTFFGKYSGTIYDNGFFWINPFYSKRKLSLRARNMDVAPIKVNDKNGNPIMIGLVLVWKIKDTFKACFDIDADTLTSAEKAAGIQPTLKGYDSFVNVQSDAALRKVAGLYAYDNMTSHADETTLRSGGDEINEKLEEELRSRLAIAGIEVVEARINYLAYASEIASVMLRRQQADAIIAAREKIVEGAVSMVDITLKKLKTDGIVDLDENQKAALVSNLMVVLCAEENANPIINAGS